MARMHTLVFGLFALGAVGCAAVAPRPAQAPNEGSASYRLVDDGHVAHYQLAIGDTATGGKPIQRVLPEYPAAMLAQCLPVANVQVQVIVGTSGKADEVRPYPAGDRQADAPFFEAARKAVLQWTFLPLQINHWSADAEGNAHAVDSTTKPFSLIYAFRFECHAGKARVTPSPATP